MAFFKIEKWRQRLSIAMTTVIFGIFVTFTASYASTTISNNIQTGGTLSVTGTTTLAATTTVSGLVFGNGWSFASTTATTSEITLYDSLGNVVAVFDEN